MDDPISIKFQQCARYHTCGRFTSKTKYVWLCCHGYGQLAEYFKRNFRHLSEEHFIIVPEGQHRFYLQGTEGRVGASWMTKEDRETDIENYIRYLDAVMADALPDGIGKGREFICFGFSQGTATISRWLLKSTLAVSHLILWAGTFPSDVNIQLSKARLDPTEVHLMHGDKDPYIDNERSSRLQTMLLEYGIDFRHRVFEGAHEIPQSDLDALIDTYIAL